jgi:hypothetical protein
VESDDRTVVGVEEQELPASPRGDERTAAERALHPRGREAALEEPCVGRVDARDRAAERARLDQRARLLDLEEFGHQTVFGRSLPLKGARSPKRTSTLRSW